MPTVEIEFTGGGECFVVVDGVRVAQRGHPDSAQAKTWISLEPGFSVISSPDHRCIEVTCNGVRLH